MLNRRPLVVLAGLIAAMTVSSGLLLLLEPGPIAPPARVINLRSQVPGSGDLSLFDTAVPLRRWSAVVIFEGRSTPRVRPQVAPEQGGQESGPLGYHFVIEDRDRRAERPIRAGYRWRHQRTAVAATGADRDWYNRNAIAICLVGDFHVRRPSEAQMRDLVELIQRLQSRFDIPPQRVRLHSSTDTSVRMGQFFPIGYLRLHLLSPAG